jgi:N-methylhydantoinase A
MYSIGVDVGGTFTDVVVIDEKGEIDVFKASTTPKNLFQGIVNALEMGAKRYKKSLSSFLKEVQMIAHGCTVGTNALITGDLARIGLITTKGFGDTMVIRRAIKGSGAMGEFVPGEYMYNLQMDRPKLLVPASLTEEVTERINYEGEVLIPLDIDEGKQKIRKLIDKKVEGIAVCLIWSPVNPAHEERIMELIKEYPAVYTNSSCSVNIIKHLREYERMSTTIVDACLKPIMKPYLQGLADGLHSKGLPDEIPVLIMQLQGGVADSLVAADKPVTTVGSGPVGGVMGAEFMSSILEYDNLITMDMGGTSFDVGVVMKGESIKVPIACVEKYHIMLPMIDVRSIGAGGGSLAYVEKGTLKVGPQSAGAEPGPACYGRGGMKPTITDANVVLGCIRGSLAAGEIVINVEASRKAIKENIADEMNMTIEHAAIAIIDIANANMVDAIRLSTIERGYDPIDFAAFVYGGLGPCHASVLCREMGIKRMVVPWFASAFSAFGMVSSDFKHTYSRVIEPELFSDLNLDVVNKNIEEMEKEGRDTLRREGIKSEGMNFKVYFDMRFEGQINDIQVAIPNLRVTSNDLPEIKERFVNQYGITYSYVPEEPVEVVGARLEALGRVFKIPIRKYPVAGKGASHAIKEKREVYFKEKNAFLETNIYDGSKMMPGNVIKDNAVIEYPHTNILLRPGQKAEWDSMRNIIIDIEK